MRPRPSALDEFALIDRIRSRIRRLPSDVVVGIGDDAAVVRGRSVGQWVFTTDLLADQVHFSLATTTLPDLGYKAAAANLSDLAAMGSTPRFLLVDVAIPARMTEEHILGFYRGLTAICRSHGVAIIGGDTSSSHAGLFIAITAIGQTDAGGAIQRKGARVGDLLFVSGTLGDSLAGLLLLQPTARHVDRLSPIARRVLLHRHRRPSPRVALGTALAARRLATAMIDLSDGLSGDLPHLCRRSAVGALVEEAKLPVSKALQAFAQATGRSSTELALQGGEDYELLFTVAPTRRKDVLALGKRLGIALTEIGRITPARSGRQLRLASGARVPLPVTSYRHFRQAAEH